MVVPIWLYKWVLKYKEIRTQLPSSPTTTSFFLSWNAKGLEQASVGNILTSTMPGDGRKSCTKIRKMTVTLACSYFFIFWFDSLSFRFRLFTFVVKLLPTRRVPVRVNSHNIYILYI